MPLCQVGVSHHCAYDVDVGKPVLETVVEYAESTVVCSVVRFAGENVTVGQVAVMLYELVTWQPAASDAVTVKL